MKPTRCTNFSNLFLEGNSTCYGQFLRPSSGVFHHTHRNGICHTGLLTACEQDQDGSILILLASCQQTCMTYTIAVRTVKNSWWWTENYLKHVDFPSKNKFEKLAHLVGFIITNLSQCTVTWTSNETHMLSKTFVSSSFLSCNETRLKIYKFIWDISFTLRVVYFLTY